MHFGFNCMRQNAAAAPAATDDDDDDDDEVGDEVGTKSSGALTLYATQAATLFGYSSHTFAVL